MFNATNSTTAASVASIGPNTTQLNPTKARMNAETTAVFTGVSRALCTVQVSGSIE